MNASYASLNEHVPWDRVCAALGVPVPGRALPLRTRCPLCQQETLYLYHDNTGGGQWHHCRRCGHGGDMIALAAAAWRVAPRAALARLVAEGLAPPVCGAPEQVDRYFDKTLGTQAAMQALWTRAQAAWPALADTPGLLRLRALLGLVTDGSRDRWAAGPGKLVGALPKNEVELAFQPGLDRPEGANRMFTGLGWQAVLTVPLYDLPDRLCSFLFMGREGLLPRDVVYRQISSRGPAGPEAGLAWLKQVGALATDHVLAMEDWPLALLLQVRHFRLAGSPLPIVGWYDDGIYRSAAAWTCLSDRKIVFWASALTPRLLRQAAETGGRIALTGPATTTREGVARYLRSAPPEDLVRRVLAAARPWQEAFKAHHKKASVGEVESFMHALEASGADVSRILRECGKGTSRRLPSPIRSVRFGFATIQWEGDSWVLTAKQGTHRRELLNATLAFTHAIQDRGTGELFYRGWIGFKGRQIPFIERVAVMQKDALGFLQAKLVELGLGMPACLDKHARDLHQIALLFREPVVVHEPLVDHVSAVRKGTATACRAATPTTGDDPCP